MLNRISIGTLRAAVIAALFAVIAILGFSNYNISNSIGHWKAKIEVSSTNLGKAAVRAAQKNDPESDVTTVIKAEYRALNGLLDVNGQHFPSSLPMSAVIALLAVGGLSTLGLWHIGRREQDLSEANKILNRRLAEISVSISKHLPGGEINASELGQDLPQEAMQLLLSFEEYAKKQAEVHDQLKRSHSESEAARKAAKQDLENAKENLEICKNAIHDCVSAISGAAQAISDNADEACNKFGARIKDLSTLKSHADSIIETYQDVMNRFDKSSKLNKKSVEHALQAQEKIGSLRDAATEIGSVVEMITRIAEHTNHLALNATIEAARAGEAGKGFNVVATEVKDLSTQTSNEMKKISQQIVSIQTATGESVAAIEDVVQTTKEVSDLALENSANPVDEASIKSMREIAENVMELGTIEHYRKQILESTNKIVGSISSAEKFAAEDK